MVKIQNDLDLLPYNTFRVSAKATRFVVLRNLSDLGYLRDLNSPIFILGEGANVLFTKNFDGLVIKNEIKGRKVLAEDETCVTLEIGAGENWSDLVGWTVENDWSGVENLAYIPGTVGAAPVQNIAAYGQNFGEVVVCVTGFNRISQELETLSYKDCKLYYRDSIFKHELKNKFIVTTVTIKLSKIPKFDTNYYGSKPYESLQNELDKIAKPPYSPKIIAQAVINQRKVKMPDWTIVGTAGSFFKNPFVSLGKLADLQSTIKDLQVYPVNAMLYPNPDDPVFKMANVVKIPAGRLLDELGWRGKRIGNVATHDKHALIVINCGGATGQEILDFTKQMQADVKNAYDIDLEPEVNII